MYSLNEKEAFDAMSLFVNRFYREAGDDLVTLIADISTKSDEGRLWHSDGGPLDPAAWSDWIKCVQAVKSQ
jgi:hypothetical protein